jgi:hypothetical protein
MSLRKLLWYLFWWTPVLLNAHDTLAVQLDASHADADGPHVFYRPEGILVKTIVRRDTGAMVITRLFTPGAAVRLTCNVGETGDRFTFRLRDSFGVEPDAFPLPGRMLVLSDIEGNFAAFKAMLLGAGVIDENFRWIFGSGHLVLLGDYFDRGLSVTECLWLAYKLESEALAAGGRLHFVLGNHEVLNLAGNTQYVRRKYLENAQLLDIPYDRWYDGETELGRWLRTKHAVVKVGEYVFCHGGISSTLARSGLPFDDINRVARQYLGIPYPAIAPADGQAVFSTDTGIFWYRGVARYKATADEVTEALLYAGARYMVIGHTLMPDISALYDGRVLCTDLFHEENIRQGVVKTLWIENGRYSSLNSLGKRMPVVHVAPPISRGEK